MNKIFVAMGVIGLALIVLSTVTAAASVPGSPCLDCHKQVTPGIVADWQKSKHAAVGVKCYVCHLAHDDDPAGRDHFGYRVTPIVSPKYCEGCHPKEVKEFRNSLHDEAAFFAMSAYATEDGKVVDGVTVGKNKNYKTNFARESANQGCLHCHGSVVKVGKDGKLINWPNNGIGRLNPDGSAGSCSACHTRHRFSVAEARKPEACGQCHLGPDHPQIEMYEESKHGAIYHSEGEKWNWNAPKDKWGTEDIRAPTCAVCHMSGFNGAVKTTHDVSARLYWELEPMFSWPAEPKYWTGKAKYPIPKDVESRYEKLYGLPAGSLSEVPTGKPNPFAIAKKFAPEVYEKYVGKGKWFEKGNTRADAYGGDALRSPEQKRADMLKVCEQCHSKSWAEGELKMADKVIDVYNAVALAIKKKYYDPIKEQKLDEDTKFNGKSRADTLWHEIWHHEGRRWRMGAFMQGPDYEHWHGAYMVSVDGGKMAQMLAWYETQKKVKSLESPVMSKETGSEKEKSGTAVQGKRTPGFEILYAIGALGAVYAIYRKRRI